MSCDCALETVKTSTVRSSCSFRASECLGAGGVLCVGPGASLPAHLVVEVAMELLLLWFFCVVEPGKEQHPLFYLCCWGNACI